MAEQEEQAYITGQRAVWVELLSLCARNLGYDSPEWNAARWMKERESVVARLRITCGDFGDNEWDEHLHMADVIDKHLGRHLQKMNVE